MSKMTSLQAAEHHLAHAAIALDNAEEYNLSMDVSRALLVVRKLIKCEDEKCEVAL